MSSSVLIDNEEHFEVENIQDKKKRQGKELYLVKWKNYEEQSWEPIESFDNCPELLEQFSKSKKRKFENNSILGDIKEKRGSIPHDIKDEIIKRDEGKCQLCLEHKERFEIDHLIPLQYNGTNSKDNLQALCYGCHKFKTSFLDNHIISKIIQSSLDKKTLTREMIMIECMTIYFTRNIKNIPTKIEETLDFISKTYPLYEKIKSFDIKF